MRTVTSPLLPKVPRVADRQPHVGQKKKILFFLFVLLAMAVKETNQDPQTHFPSLSSGERPAHASRSIKRTLVCVRCTPEQSVSDKNFATSSDIGGSLPGAVRSGASPPFRALTPLQLFVKLSDMSASSGLEDTRSGRDERKFVPQLCRSLSGS